MARLLGIVVLGVAGFWPASALAEEVSTGFFVRQDSDKTTVVAPRVAAAKTFNDERTRVDASYSADIWTSASIDMRTAATNRITEQRDQITAAVSHEFNKVSAGANYYFSHEGDYNSHGFGLYVNERIAGGAATLEQRLLGSFDQVGKSGDPGFALNANMIGGRFVYTQIINPQTILQGAAELRHRRGYQSSPYRFVGLGGDGQCGSTAILCVPEQHPDIRNRAAFVFHGRHSLADDSSVGLGYRLYVDDWGLLSHTGIFQFSSLFGEESAITFRYRFYTQREANFYRSTYDVPAGQVGNVTRDKELSPILSNRVALSYDTLFELDRLAGTLRLAAAAGFTAFIYNDFIGLDEVYSGDFNLALTLEL